MPIENRQMDMFVNAEDAAFHKGSREMQALIDSLPQAPLLRVWDVTQALGVCEDTVTRWIQAGKFSSINVTAGPKDNPRYRIYRYSFLEFLRSRISKGGSDAR